MNTKPSPWIFSLLVLIFSVSSLLAGEINWRNFPPVPDKEGFAGMFAGVSDDRLIVAGGANFPGKRPWEGGQKVWYDHIYFLDAVDGVWQKSGQKLPQPLAYGVSVTYADKVWIIGGNDASGHVSQVLTLSYQAGEIRIDTDYPRLPVPLANMAGAVVDGVLYIQGGQESPEGLAREVFFMLDLRDGRSEMEWLAGPSFPGVSRIQAVAAAQEGKFYLFSGFHLTTNEAGGNSRELLRDAYRYLPGARLVDGKWERLKDLPRGVAAAPSPAFSLGNSHILISGGLDEKTLTHSDPATHPGFLDEMLAYNSRAEEWVQMGAMPGGTSRVTAPTAYWKGYWIVPNGEKGPGVRSPAVLGLQTQNQFGWANWTSLCVYLCCMLGIGFYFSKRDKSTAQFFLAGGRIPWWAAGLSIYGTQLSAITFMAIPVIVYATDWRLALGSFMIFAIVPIIIRFYLPFFRRLRITTAYQYLELRFNVKVRLLGSLTFILLQLARMGVVVFLPAIAISSVTGMNIYLCIAIMGVFSTAYTVLGGMEAVIWTDVVQVVVLLGGALFSLFLAIGQIDGGLAQVIQVGVAHEKFTLVEWSWDYTQLVFWVAVIGFFFLNLISYTSDQVVIQRYLTVKSEAAAAKSLWTNGILTLPGILLFFGLGTVLYVYYLSNPQKIGSTNPEELLPYFIVAELPVGIAGLVIAGIFAASMSSLDSSMNSIATAYITDIHSYFNPQTDDRKSLRLAKIITVLMGLFGTLAAMWIASSDIGYIFDLFQKLLGMIGGSLAGVFMLAIFTQRANATGAIIGTLCGAGITFMISRFSDVNGYLYGAIGVISCFAIGYVASLFFPKGRSQPQGYTYRSLVKK